MWGELYGLMRVAAAVVPGRDPPTLENLLNLAFTRCGRLSPSNTFADVRAFIKSIVTPTKRGPTTGGARVSENNPTVTMGRRNRDLITNALNAADSDGLQDGTLLYDIEWRAVLAALGPQRLLSALAVRAVTVAPVVSTLNLPKGCHTLDRPTTYWHLILALFKVGQGRRGHVRACNQQARVELPLGNGLSIFIGYDTDYLAVFTS